MCMIAGYAGNRRAAPILIEMMRRQQYIDGGRSTGIATLHEGKLYTAKINGNLDRFLAETDGADLPGNVGIMHSRTGDDMASHAHPFTSQDEKLAVVTNGTRRDLDLERYFGVANAIMADFYNRGYTIKTAYDAKPKDGPAERLPDGRGYLGAETEAFMVEEYVETHPELDKAQALREGFWRYLSTLPRDMITLGVHADLPDTITIATVTRPMHWAHIGEESYLATCPLGMPDEVQQGTMVPIPQCSISQVTAAGLYISDLKPEGVSTEQVDMRICALFYDRLEALLRGKEDEPLSIYDFNCYKDWRDLWSEPLIDCKFGVPGGCLKPSSAATYRALWNFHTEGRLHSVIGERKGYPIMKFWLDR